MLLSLSDVEKSFGPVAVLRGVSFDVKKGSVHALLGENGAGKSTLMRILLGIEHADRGRITLDGSAYHPRAPGDARRAGVVMVPQERTLALHLSVAENVLLGIEPSAGGLLKKRELWAAAEKALALVTGEKRRIDASARAGSLSVADQQLVEIARALAQGGETARILVLDEPTSSLGQDDAVRLFERVHALKERGIAIILVTHFLADVRAHADRYTVLRDGKVQGDGDPKAVPAAQIVHEMLGRELEAALEAANAETKDGDVLLEVKDLAGSKKPKRASFVLRRGEIFGIAGLVGAGRTELLRAILGLDPTTKGSIDRRAPKGIGLLSEDRGGEGLMLRRSIAENVTLSRHAPLFELPRAVRAEGAKWIKELGVRARDAEQAVGELSGGNQQKVQVARLVREDYDVLLVDEPTRGIDVAAKAQVLALLRTLATKGKGIVLVSSQLEELVSTCDRIAVLKNGELGDALPAARWTEEKLLLEAAS